jgi:AcrR family transcriptional regulator
MVPADVTTRTRILTAATTLFARYGFKRTTMEDIASEAGLSRASLYLQFRSKEGIFRELARDLHEGAIERAEAALEEKAPLAERLRSAVEAKTMHMMEIANSSPHGSELMDENNRLCGDLATDSEMRLLAMVTKTLTAADKAREINLCSADLSAKEAAEVFLHSVSGLKRSGLDAYSKQLAALARVFVAGLAG